MSGILRRPGHVGIVEEGGAVYLGVLPAGPLVVLDGTALAVWHAAQCVERGAVAARVADELGLDRADIAESVERFVDDLMARGLLEAS